MFSRMRNRPDIARLNLITGRGLPGCAGHDEESMLKRLDEWTMRVKMQTLRSLPQFDPKTDTPADDCHYGRSFARFLCYHLLRVLQLECGVRYHPHKRDRETPLEPQDVFIHGILDPAGLGGTCASLPVVYTAVGRRLGYPLKLVQAREHLLFRWESPQGMLLQWSRLDSTIWVPADRFNVEGSCDGFGFHSDDYYRSWPVTLTEADIEANCYLKSMTFNEEMASFLIERSECWYDLGNWTECLRAIYFARNFAPDDVRYRWLHGKRSYEFEEFERRRTNLKAA